MTNFLHHTEYTEFLQRTQNKFFSALSVISFVFFV